MNVGMICDINRNDGGHVPVQRHRIGIGHEKTIPLASANGSVGDWRRCAAISKDRMIKFAKFPTLYIFDISLLKKHPVKTSLSRP